MSGNTDNLQERIVKSSIWLIGGRFLMRSLGLISISIVARILTPEDFGKVAVIFSMMAILEIFFSFGVENYIIQKKGADRSDFDTVWTLSIIRGIFVSLILLIFTYAYDLYSGKNEYFLGGIVIAAIVLIESFQNTGFLAFAKKIDFSKEFILRLVAKIASVAATIAGAYYWRDYRGLLIGSLVGAVLTVGLSYLMSRYRPRLSLVNWREVYRFSVWLTIGNAIFALSSRFDAILLSRYLGNHAAGLFSVSRDLSSLTTSELVGPLNRVMLSGFSETKSDTARFKALYLKAVSLVVLAIVPVGIGVSIIAEDFVPLFLGDQWNEAVFFVQAISIMMAIQMISVNFMPIFLSLGNTKTIMVRSMIYALFRPSLFTLGIYVGELKGAVIGYCVAGLLLTLIEYILLSRYLEISLGELISRIWRIVAAILAMAAVCHLVVVLMPASDEIHLRFLRIAILGGVGAVTYSGVVLFLWQLGGRPDGAESTFLSLIRGGLARFGRA